MVKPPTLQPAADALQIDAEGVDAATGQRLRLCASEAHYRELYDGAPVAYLSYDTQGFVQRWNRRAEEIFGYSGRELRGMSFRDLAADTPSGKPLCEDLFRKFLAGIETVSEIEGRRVDGAPLWVHATVRPLRDADGTIVASQSILVDITAQKLAEEALRESEERYRHLYDDAPVAYLTFGPEARLCKVNRRCCTVFRMSEEELIGKTIFEVVADTPEGKARLQAQFDRVLAGQDTFEDEELEVLRGDGTTCWFRFSSAVTRRAGEMVEVRTMGVDITDRKLAEAKARELERHTAYLKEEIRETRNFDEIVGQSPALHGVLRQVRLVAATSSTVLIGGETGTGKELIARAIHAASRRHTHPFIKVNCAALPAGLIESELFGHERGAFTGATDRRIGRFELAHDGTIFLDEVGEMPLDLQVKLLRVLQEQAFERVGGSHTITVDVRVIAATNRDLPAAVAAGTFRQDLFYRLNVFPLTAPPLRERPGDIALLVPYFVARYAAKIGRRITSVPETVLRDLVTYAWPGNVRELENVIERAVILSPETGPLAPSGVPLTPLSAPFVAPGAVAPDRAVAAAHSGVMPRTLENVERAHVIAVLSKTAGRIDGPSGAALILDIHPNTLRSRMKKMGIHRTG